MLQTTERRVTQKDVAKEAKLSIAAVSMALKGHRELPQATIDRVRKIADDLGYAPDPALSALVARRSSLRGSESFSVLAYVTLSDDSEPRVASPRTKLLHLTAVKRAKELGYRLEPFSVSPDSLACLGKVLSDRGIRGLLLSPELEMPKEPDVSWSELCAVSLRNQRPGRCHTITSDSQVDIELCWKNLCEKGHRRIGLLIDEHDSDGMHDTLQFAHLYSQLKYAEDTPLAQPVFIFKKDHSADDLKSWIVSQSLDAVISNKSASLELLSQAGLSVPSDVALLSLNAEADSPMASGIITRTEEISTLAIDTLNTMIQHNRFGPQHAFTSLKVAGQWNDGGTY